MRAAWAEVQDELTAASEDVARVRESYDAYLSQATAYAKDMTIPMLSGRG
jgi:phage-related tail protein